MKENDQISKVTNDIKGLKAELTELAAQLGGVVYDSEVNLPDTNIISEIDSMEKSIPEIKKKMEKLKSYNLSISEAEDGLKQCTEKIKEYKGKIKPIMEKVGVELYCYIGEKELAYTTIKLIYDKIKKGEARSEELENSLTLLMQNQSKLSVTDFVKRPFKINNIKHEIKQNNKESLKNFRDLGQVYVEIPQLIEEESNESLLDVLQEYKDIVKNIKSQEEKEQNLQNRIKENEKKIEEDSHGVKLKSLYSNFEKEIVDIQSGIANKLIELGFYFGSLADFNCEISEINAKKHLFDLKQGEIGKKESLLIYLENVVKEKQIQKDIKERQKSIQIEEDHIAMRQKSLAEHKVSLQSLEDEAEKLGKWLEENSMSDQI